MKIAYEKESRQESTRRYWEKRHGIKIGQKVKFNTKAVESSGKKRGRTRVVQKIRTGVLVDLYPHVALFDFNGIKRCIKNEILWTYLEGRELEW